MSSTRSSKLLSSDSSSVWNFTLSPGWNKKEIEVLRLAIMKYGVGSWKAISSAKVLPGKTTTQIVGQVQRMMGQQSLREFLKIKLDPLLVGKDNAKKHNVSRKSGIIVNEGHNLSKEEFQALHQANKEKYALPESTVQAIVIPKLTIQETSTDIGLQERKLIERRNAIHQLAEYRATLKILRGQSKGKK